MTPDELIEHVAAAICTNIFGPGATVTDEDRDNARAAISATLEGIGEPTGEMLEAGVGASVRSGSADEVVKAEWKAMLATLQAQMKGADRG